MRHSSKAKSMRKSMRFANFDDDKDAMASIRANLRKVLEGEGTADWEGSAAYAAFRRLVGDRVGDWAEVNDTDGSVLGEALIGKTVYWNTATSDVLFTKPAGWVRMQTKEREALRQKQRELSRTMREKKPAHRKMTLYERG